MIKYRLKCKKCESIFDSWFASSKEFDKLKKIKLINCNTCNSLEIEKSIMSPRISSITKSNLQASEKTIEIKSKIKSFKIILKKF